MMIVDEEGKTILAAQNIDDAQEMDSYQRKPGIYKTVCLLKPDIFGEKHLFLSVHLELPKVEHLVLDRAIGFNINFVGYSNIMDNLKGAFIRPKLKWETHLVQERIKEKNHE